MRVTVKCHITVRSSSSRQADRKMCSSSVVGNEVPLRTCVKVVLEIG